MKFDFSPVPPPQPVTLEEWSSWSWQLRRSAKTLEDFVEALSARGLPPLQEGEREAFQRGADIFRVRATPYYLSLIRGDRDPIRRILVPDRWELETGAQSEVDPLGEKKNNPVPRIIHRYPDRVLFLVTDTCSVYCRYCTRKHFTGHDHALVSGPEYDQALEYLRRHPGVREVILSGGDPLTLNDKTLERILSDLRSIEHVEIIRVGSRMPVVCPMRVDASLAAVLRKYKPVYLMVHFNHPREITREAAAALEILVDHGVPVLNQMVLLNGVNNHPAVVQALSRRLLYLRVKPYYMFQCDPSQGTDHLRTSVEESLSIQRELWGVLSGLALPTLSLDIPNGGGKTSLVPDFLVSRDKGSWNYRGWDGVEGEYRDPDPRHRREPADWRDYAEEWELTRTAKVSDKLLGGES